MDDSLTGSSIHGIFQARVLEWGAIAFSEGLVNCKSLDVGTSLVGSWYNKEATVAKESESKVAQSCPTLSDPTDCSPPGSSIHGIFQARVLEWGAIAFSKSRTK